MQKCFLVSNKVTQVRDYLEHRSIIEVTEEHRSLMELDLGHLGIVDVDKFIYLYYGSDDGDLAFRSDLNVFRQLLGSAFFHTSEAIFVLVDCQNPLLEDLIHTACRETNLVGAKLDVNHHTGALTLNDVSKYITGSVIGAQTSSSYKQVFVKEEESEERERYTNISDGVNTILPVLTDQYVMYKRRVEVEAISSSRTVIDGYTRPQIMRDFSKLGESTVRRWSAFLLSGEPYTKFEQGANYLVDYFGRVGLRAMIVDVTSRCSTIVRVASAKEYGLGELANRSSFVEQAGYLKCCYNQLGYVVEMLGNIEGVNQYIFVCDGEDYEELQVYLTPLCDVLYSNYVSHFTEEAVQDYLARGIKSTTVFLSQAVCFVQFDVSKYRQEFEGQRVALFGVTDVDTTDYFECATGGGLV